MTGPILTLKTDDAEYELRWIPAGEFEMGSPTKEKDRESDETLHHVVLTRGFWMLETPTTQALYREIMGTNPSCFDGDRLPVETVSWREATAFCEELTSRLPQGWMASLPTEAQWEYACRAGKNTPYWYGYVFDSGRMNNGGTTTPVKSYCANGWGLYDMIGNVMEWTSDCYGDYPPGIATDPLGAPSGVYRAARGGSWRFCAPEDCRSARRIRLSADCRDNDLGFRFILSVAPDEAATEDGKDGRTDERIALNLGTRKTLERPEVVERPTKTPSQLEEEARKELRAGRCEEAERLASEALRFNPTLRTAASVLAESREKQKKRRKFDQILSEGETSLNNGDYETALRKATTVLSASSDDKAALELKSRAKDAIFAKLLVEGETCLDVGDRENALRKANAALKARPNDSAAFTLKRRAEDAIFAKLLVEGETCLEVGDYEIALRYATTLLKERPDDPAALELKSRAEDAIFAKLSIEGETCLDVGDYETALRKATTALKMRPDDEGALELKNRAGEALRPAASPLWWPSSSRKARFRQTLKIGNAEYGFVWIPAGEFDMGSPETEEGRNSDETLHHVKLTQGFWMLETEVPQALYQEIMGTNPSRFEGDNLPVEMVSWQDATKFCEELRMRLPKGLRASLPTEAQWEYACRAGTTTPYSFGNALNGDKANCDGNYPYGTETKGKRVGKTTPVKSYAPNAWGLYDMHGNVREWALDYYGDYPTGTVIDPTGPDSASFRVVRGGRWDSYAGICRSAYRFRFSAGDRSYDLGFRFLLSCD